MKEVGLEKSLEIKESILLVLGVALSSLVGVIVGIAASMSGGTQTVGVDFLMYLLLSAIVCSAIWIGFMIYTEEGGATFIILLSILALMLLNLALPPVKYAPIAYGVIGASIVTIFVYAMLLRSS